MTGPALREDGKIDAALADAQLRLTVHPVASSSARRRGNTEPGPAATSTTAAPTGSVEDLASHRTLLQARATIASVTAERARRELEHERGRYTLTADADDAFAKMLAGFLLDVENSLPDLATEIGVDLPSLRRWWRDQRSRAAGKARTAAAGQPEFVIDPEAPAKVT